MSKLFTVAGTSALEGVVKFRVANGSAAARSKVLTRSGHTDIKLVDLATPMTKEDAFAFVQANGAILTVKAPAEKVAKAPKQKTVKLATIVKKVSKKFVAEKSVRAINASFAAKSAEVPAEQPSANSIAEIAKIKAKNLETMRRVSNRLAALRSYN